MPFSTFENCPAVFYPKKWSSNNWNYGKKNRLKILYRTPYLNIRDFFSRANFDYFLCLTKVTKYCKMWQNQIHIFTKTISYHNLLNPLPTPLFWGISYFLISGGSPKKFGGSKTQFYQKLSGTFGLCFGIIPGVWAGQKIQKVDRK